ncbi:MAG: 4-hydroxy-tetrahydrodipicolinate reductase [Bacteroidales bacterium]|nr:4-hydroxy-tetrahydrodipicolinate reductase [Bacteroidales bacterium]
MNIAIIGYGKMGREIEAVAGARGHNISLVIDIDNFNDLNKQNLGKVDVAMEFSSPEAAFRNIMTCLENKTPVVSGTTGWLDKWDKVVDICNRQGGSLFYASNFSIGVNILFALNTHMAKIMSRFPRYEVSMKEIHHVHKLDAPSGTAITMADQITAGIPDKTGWTLDPNESDKIRIEAIREGEVNGYHRISYESDVDTIAIEHNAKSRKGFATGAIMAAEYLKDKKGIHSMKDMLNL